jgi:hypothetical protein
VYPASQLFFPSASTTTVQVKGQLSSVSRRVVGSGAVCWAFAAERVYHGGGQRRRQVARHYGADRAKERDGDARVRHSGSAPERDRARDAGLGATAAMKAAFREE